MMSVMDAQKMDLLMHTLLTLLLLFAMDAQEMDLLKHTDCVISCVIVHYGCPADGLTDAYGHC